MCWSACIHVYYVCMCVCVGVHAYTCMCMQVYVCEYMCVCAFQYKPWILISQGSEMCSLPWKCLAIQLERGNKHFRGHREVWSVQVCGSGRWGPAGFQKWCDESGRSSQKRQSPGGHRRGGEVWWVEPAERGRDRTKPGRSLNHSSGHADRRAAWGASPWPADTGARGSPQWEGRRRCEQQRHEWVQQILMDLPTGQPPPGLRCLQLPLGVSLSDTGAVKSQFFLELVSSFTVFLDSRCFSQPLWFQALTRC